MSKEVQILAYCDGDHPHRTPATTEHTITLDDGKPVVMDVCDEHDALFIQLAALMEVGSPAAVEPKAKAKTGGAYHVKQDTPCGFPGCNKGPHNGPFVAQSRTGLGAHMTKQHGVTLRDFELANPPST